MHRFANEIFAQDRPQCGAAVSAPRERRSSRALQLDIAPLAVAVQDFAEEDCAAVAKLGMVVVVDDQDRENEGDLVMAAEAATPETIAFFLAHTSGVIGSAPEGVTLPANIAASRSGSRPCVFTPSSEASESLNLIRWGFATGVGASRAKKCSGRRA